MLSHDILNFKQILKNEDLRVACGKKIKKLIIESFDNVILVKLGALLDCFTLITDTDQ